MISGILGEKQQGRKAELVERDLRAARLAAMAEGLQASGGQFEEIAPIRECRAG